MTVFAAVRLTRQRYQEAEMLLQLAHDACVQSGDMQQMVVGMLLLADVEFHSGSLPAAKYLLCESDRVLQEDCDATRHHRLVRLKLLVEQRLWTYKGAGRSRCLPVSWN